MLDSILYFFRDSIAGVRYFIYAFVGIILIFAIVGYMYKQKYTKYGVKINIGASNQTSPPKSKKEEAKEKKEAEKKAKLEKALENKKNKKKSKNKKETKKVEPDVPTNVNPEVNKQEIPEIK